MVEAMLFTNTILTIHFSHSLFSLLSLYSLSFFLFKVVLGFQLVILFAGGLALVTSACGYRVALRMYPHTAAVSR